ncbi:hypothetical protein B0A55_11403, partial [Friedmanniomyces simplex]
ADEFGKRKGGRNGVKGGSKNEQDFTYFRLGETGGGTVDGVNAPSLAAIAAERAQIATKLSALQLARRKSKQDRQQQQQQTSHSTRRPSSSLGQTNGNTHNGESGDATAAVPVTITISWRHLERSLGMTRASVSGQERSRLEGIYREFVVGRKGEMADGQGGTEVGGGVV